MVASYDRVLLEVGDEGIYQKKFDIIYNVVLASFWAMAYYNIIFALTVTPHTCKLPEKPPHVSEIDWKSKYIPTETSVGGKGKYSDCLIYTNQENNETKACDYFDYDTTWFETTVASDNNWVCNKEILVANIFAYTKIGELVGSMFFGWFGDVYGRKLTYIISLALLVIGRFISVLASTSFTLFAIGCIIASFPSWSAPQSATIISLEISSARRRSTLAKLRLVSTSFGMFLLPFMFWWLRNWKSFLIITTISQVPCLLLSWKLLESPQWLWINGKTKAAIKNLKRIAKVNKTTLNPDTESEILTTAAITSNTEVLGVIALFSGWQLAVNTILQLFIWSSVVLNYTVIVMSSGEKPDGNPFLDFAWQSLAEIPGYFIGAWLADRIGRRYTGICSFLLTSIIWIINGYRDISNKAWIKSEWLSLFLVVTNRCSITVSYYIINLLNMELYPTCIRQSGISLGNVISSGASALAPYILFLGRRVDVRLPSLILTVTTLLGGVFSTFFLPETGNAKLPETLEDAKHFGRWAQLSANVKPEDIEM